MVIDGSNIESLGLVLIRKSGFFDMPSRVFPVAYDWGDTIEPFVEAEQISFQGQQFKAECLHDPRKGGTISSAVASLQAMAEVNVDLEGASGSVGQYLCQILSVNQHRPYGNADKISINFYHRVPVFSAALPGSPSGGSSSFGEYSFSQFGIRAVLRRDFVTLNALTEDRTTTYLTSGMKSPYRQFQRVGLDCYLVASSQADRIQKMESFKTLLSQPGLQALTHMGTTFPTTFFSDGFKVTPVGTKVLKFTMYLNVVP